MQSIWLLNGANLNLLGTREPERYGTQSLDDISTKLTELARDYALVLHSFQSNSESVLVDKVQHAKHEGIRGIIINPGAFAHTSIALRDAFLATQIPFIEIHISNIYARESFRHHSYLADIAQGVIVGLGPYGYELALRALVQHLAVDYR